MPKHYKGKTGAAKTKALKEHYAQNPYGPPGSYAGKGGIPSLINEKPVTEKDQEDKKEIQTAYKDKDAPKPDKKNKDKKKHWSEIIQYV